MDGLISVIVPIYNVEPYLEKCINSIINQTYSNLEIILVDDGSTDGSSKICDTFVKKDDRVKVIHQKNGGLTVTRRAGVDLAQGEYIGFVDGDDWVEPNMYQTLLDYICNKKVDIVTSRGYREYFWGTGDSILGDTIPVGVYNVDAEDSYILTHLFPGLDKKNEAINGAVWNKLFRADIIKSVLKEIDKHVHGYMDDTVCVIGSILRAERIMITRDILYHHREREDSFTYLKNARGLLQVNYGYLALKQIIEQSVHKEKLMPDLIEYVSHSFLHAFNNLFCGQEYSIPQYFFKSNVLPVFSKVLLYGAGKVGRSYWRQFKAEGKYELLGIIDRNVLQYEEFDNIYKIDSIEEMEFDFIIIAIKDEKTVKEVKGELQQRKVPFEKIIWERPVSIFEYFGQKEI